LALPRHAIKKKKGQYSIHSCGLQTLFFVL